MVIIIEHKSDKKILCIAPYKELVNEYKNTASSLGIEVWTFQGLIGDLSELKKQVKNKWDVEVIVARGATATYLRDYFSSISVVEIPITTFDIMTSVLKAQKMGKNILLVGHEGYKTKFDQICKIKQVFHDVSILDAFLYHSGSEKYVEDKILSFGINNEAVIVSGTRWYQLAARHNIKSVLIESNRESIKEALTQAMNLEEYQYREKEKTTIYKALTDFSFEGLIVLDTDYRIIICNKITQKIFHLSGDILGKGISETPLPEQITNLFLNEENALSKIVHVENLTLVTNRAPLVFENQTIGHFLTFQNITEIQELEQKLRQKLVKRGLQSKYTFDDIKHVDNRFDMKIKKAKNYSSVDSNILIFGETGTGKEMFAQSIHNESKRKNGPFVAVNCAALSDSLLESEIFGYVEGAFTGAKKDGKAGMFELAHGGTIFLDEISSTPIPLQMKLLRVIQEKEVMRLGDTKVIPIDVRIISATNEDLEEKIRNGEFREDLFYRLKVLTLNIPPLRERPEDILILLDSYFEEHAREYNLRKPTLTEEARYMLQSYSWPGNIRELINVSENLVVLQKNCAVGREDLHDIISINSSMKNNNNIVNRKTKVFDHKEDIKEYVADIEKNIISQIIDEMGMSKKDAASVLGIHRSTLWRKLK